MHKVEVARITRCQIEIQLSITKLAKMSVKTSKQQNAKPGGGNIKK